MAIESFVAGGAQKQISLLEERLSKTYEVKFLTHNKKNFFNIPSNKVIAVDRGKFGKLGLCVFYIRAVLVEKPDVIIAYGLNSAFLCEVARLFVKFRLIVSERNLKPNASGISLYIRRLMHFFMTDEIFVNSKAQYEDLKIKYPYLKVNIIRNTILQNEYLIKNSGDCGANDDLRILGIGKYLSQKNILFFINIIHRFKKNYPNKKISVKWFGDVDGHDKQKYYNECIEAIDQKNINVDIELHPQKSDIFEEYSWASVFVLPSVSEGTPNVALEAMLAGLPICLSDVSDNRLLVTKGVNGFILSLQNIDDWVAALGEITSWSVNQYQNCASENKRILERYYGTKNLSLIENLVKN